MPEILPESLLVELKSEFSKLETATTSYSDKRHYIHYVQWENCPKAIQLVAYPPIISFLDQCLGDELICTGCSYARTDPGYPSMAIHTDSQPYGSAIFGMQASSPILIRVLYYLDDITPECAPLTVIPYSHLSLHSDANPYRRYKSHTEAESILCPAGSAVIINQKLFHGVSANNSNRSREFYAVSYRPAWAGPIAEIEDNPPDKIDALPENVRVYFKSLNTKKYDYNVKNWSDEMPTEGIGLGPKRWNQEQ